MLHALKSLSASTRVAMFVGSWETGTRPPSCSSKCGTCAECVQLWRDYRKIATQHVDLFGRHRIAFLGHNPGEAQVLQEMLEEADEERVAALEAIRRHEQTVHRAAETDAVALAS